MKLLIVRHGESDKNISDVVQGDSDASDLTEKGRRQAEQLSQKLANEKIDSAYVSPLRRARQTAEIVLSRHPETQISFFSQLIERSFGKYQGQDKALWHHDWKASGLPYSQFKPEGGESWREAGERVTNFIRNEIIAKHQSSNDTVLVVGHGSTLMHFIMTMDDQSADLADDKAAYDRYHPHNTAITVIEVDEKGEHRVNFLNDISHLEEPPKD